MPSTTRRLDISTLCFSSWVVVRSKLLQLQSVFSLYFISSPDSLWPLADDSPSHLSLTARKEQGSHLSQGPFVTLIRPVQLPLHPIHPCICTKNFSATAACTANALFLFSSLLYHYHSLTFIYFYASTLCSAIQHLPACFNYNWRMIHFATYSIHLEQRKNGLFKKAYELGVLCSVDVAVIIFGLYLPPCLSSLFQFQFKLICVIVSLSIRRTSRSSCKVTWVLFNGHWYHDPAPPSCTYRFLSCFPYLACPLFLHQQLPNCFNTSSHSPQHPLPLSAALTCLLILNFSYSDLVQSRLTACECQYSCIWPMDSTPDLLACTSCTRCNPSRTSYGHPIHAPNLCGHILQQLLRRFSTFPYLYSWFLLRMVLMLASKTGSPHQFFNLLWSFACILLLVITVLL